MSSPKVAIIILNWNGKYYTIECIESLKKIIYLNYEIILVDNGSKDDSVKCLKDRYPDIKIIINKKNLGFAEGNNIAIKAILKNKYVRYIALLNNDTKVEPYWLEELISVAESDKKIGACQSKILSMSDPSILDAVGISISKNGEAIQEGYKTRDVGQYEQVREIFGPCAGAVLYRREMLSKIGLFDEDFFAYYEDVDIAFRARFAKWKCAYVPKSIVYHAHSGTLGKKSSLKFYFLTRNEYYYKIKNLPTDILIRFFIKRPIVLIFIILKFIKKKEFKLIHLYLKGNFDAVKNIFKMLKKRKIIQTTKLIQDKELKRWFV